MGFWKANYRGKVPLSLKISRGQAEYNLVLLKLTLTNLVEVVLVRFFHGKVTFLFLAFPQFTLWKEATMNTLHLK